MANPKPADSAAPESVPEPAKRKHDPRKLVRVYDTVTGKKLSNPVPETHLDGRFPRLKEVPSSKKVGK